MRASMKTILLILTLVTCLTGSVFARVGETRQQIDTRYGQGTKTNDRLTAPGVETWKFDKAGYQIEVILLNGKSIWEVFHRKGQLISDEDVKGLIDLYDTTTTNWRFDRKDKQWKRSGKPKLIAYRWPGHEDYFCIKDVDACEAAEKGRGAGAGGL